MANLLDTQAAFLSEYEDFAGNGASRAPEWLKEIRSQGITRFREVGLPNTKIEEWRFTSLKPMARQQFELVHGTEKSVSLDDIGSSLLDPGHPRIVFLNGRFSEELSQLNDLPEGLTVTGLASEVDAGSDLVKRHLGQYAQVERNPFTALSSAFASDGAVIRVESGKEIPTLLEVVLVSVPEAQPFMTHPRNLVVLEPNSQLSLVESFLTVGDGVHLTNPVTEVIVGEGARGTCYRFQRESQESYHTATTQIHQDKDSRFELDTFSFGSALMRHDINVVLEGTGSDSTVNGLYVLEGRQHADYHTTLEHAKPHCDSHEYFNGIIDGRAQAVFNGRIVVRQDAQKTDSKQTNNNLLLSKSARADSQPQLEIYADDVKCTHGATLGPLDEEGLFYLRSRGLEPEAARRLMTYGFGLDVISRVKHPAVRDYVDRLVTDRLGDPQG